MRARVWVVVDMEYQPHPLPVEASPSHEAMIEDARERNEREPTRKRFKVYAASFPVKL